MTNRETNSMIAHKHFIDAYFSLPISMRVELEPVFKEAIGINMAALKQYRAEVRKTATAAVNGAAINKRWLTIEEEVVLWA